MPSEIFVDLWSDVVCPYCYLGARQLDDALEAFVDAPVVVRRHAFELDPAAPLDYPGTLDDMLAAKYGVEPHQARAMNDRVAHAAQAQGRTWDLARARPTNTFDAHRLIAHAGTHDLDAAMSERLHRAYFSDGLLVSDHEVLTSLADEVGVPDAGKVLAGNDYGEQVRHDEGLARRIGLTGVPAFVIAGRILVSGAQGSEALVAALRRASDDVTPATP